MHTHKHSIFTISEFSTLCRFATMSLRLVYSPATLIHKARFWKPSWRQHSLTSWDKTQKLIVTCLHSGHYHDLKKPSKSGLPILQYNPKIILYHQRGRWAFAVGWGWKVNINVSRHPEVPILSKLITELRIVSWSFRNRKIEWRTRTITYLSKLAPLYSCTGANLESLSSDTSLVKDFQIPRLTWEYIV